MTGPWVLFTMAKGGGGYLHVEAEGEDILEAILRGYEKAWWSRRLADPAEAEITPRDYAELLREHGHRLFYVEGGVRVNVDPAYGRLHLIVRPAL